VREFERADPPVPALDQRVVLGGVLQVRDDGLDGEFVVEVGFDAARVCQVAGLSRHRPSSAFTPTELRVELFDETFAVHARFSPLDDVKPYDPRRRQEGILAGRGELARVPFDILEGPVDVVELVQGLVYLGAQRLGTLAQACEFLAVRQLL
jgi:hypothetical protein